MPQEKRTSSAARSPSRLPIRPRQLQRLAFEACHLVKPRGTGRGLPEFLTRDRFRGWISTTGRGMKGWRQFHAATGKV